MSKRLSDAEKLELKRILARGGIGAKIAEQLDTDDNQSDLVLVELQTLAKGLEAKLEAKAEAEHLREVMRVLQTMMDQISSTDIINSFTILESKMNGIKEAVVALAIKLDANASVGETDHESTVRNELN